VEAPVQYSIPAVAAAAATDLPGTDGTMMRRLHALQIVMVSLVHGVSCVLL